MTTHKEKGRSLEFRCNGFSGKDSVIGLLGKLTQARYVARRLLRGPWKDADPDKTPLIIKMPHGVYRITDSKGNVEHYDQQLADLGG